MKAVSAISTSLLRERRIKKINIVYLLNFRPFCKSLKYGKAGTLAQAFRLKEH
jgi:hypothetical protein